MKPLYKNFDNDFINFWELLDVKFGASEYEVRNKYLKHIKENDFEEEVDEYYVAFKLLRDKRFEKVYNDTKSLIKTYDAGFFLDSMDYIADYKFESSEFMPVIPMHKIKFDDSKKNIVLISTGGFSPVHEGHLHTLEIAKQKLENNGYNVIGGYLSPSHDHYVSKKDNGKAHNHSLNRIRLCNEAILDSDWLMTSSLESVYTETSINYTDAIDAIKQQLKYYFNKDILVAYVFGGDNAPFIRAFQESDVAVCVSRNHERENIFHESDISHLNYLYIKENPFTNVSSTKIRKIKKDESKVESSNLYLIRDDFHFYDQVPKEFSPISDLKNLFEKTLPEMKFLTIDVEDQIKKASSYLDEKTDPTLSLDVYLKGDINLEISRIFNISDSQIRAEGFIKRPEAKECFYKTKENIKSNDYILIEDDVASGQTLNFVKTLLPKDSKFNEQVLLSKFSEVMSEDHFDIVDMRDFIVNAPYGGLVVRDINKTFRAPYIAPFVDLISRASIPAEKVIDFSIEILQLNIDFYQDLDISGIDIELNEETKKLFEFSNFKNYHKLKPTRAIIHYCERQILFLIKGIYE